MKTLRRVIAGLLVTLTVLATLWGGLTWWFDHTLLDAAQVQRTVAAVLTSRAAQDAITAALSDLATQTAPVGPAEESQIQNAVHTALGNPQVAASIPKGFGSVQQLLLSNSPADRVTVDLTPLRTGVTQALAAANPQLALAEITRQR